MESRKPYRKRKEGVSSFLNTGSPYYLFFLAIDLHLSPEEKLSGVYDLSDRTESVKELVYGWCTTGFGGLTGEGKWRLLRQIDSLGDCIPDRSREDGDDEG